MLWGIRERNNKKINLTECIGFFAILTVIACVAEPDLYVRGINYLYCQSVDEKVEEEEQTKVNQNKEEKQGCLEKNGSHREGVKSLNGK